MLLNLLYLSSKLARDHETIRLRVGVNHNTLSVIIEAFECSGQLEKGDELSLSIAKKVMELHRGEILPHALPPGKLSLEIRFPQ